MPYLVRTLFLALLLNLGLTTVMFSQNSSPKYYRLTTQWQGESKSLDIINNGENNRLKLANTKNVSSQYWQIISLGNGYFRFTNKWLGQEKSIDLLQEGNYYIPQIAGTGNFSGQNWKLSKVDGSDEFFRLSTMWQGDGLALDIVNDGEKNNKPRLSNVGNYSGQFWKLTLIATYELATVVDRVPKEPKKNVPIGKKYEKEITEGMKKVQELLDKKKKKN